MTLRPPGTETVTAGSDQFTRLIGSFHLFSPVNAGVSRLIFISYLSLNFESKASGNSAYRHFWAASQ